MGKKIDSFIDEFYLKHIHDELVKYLNTYLTKILRKENLNGKNVEEISNKYIKKKNDENNLNNYYLNP